MKVLLKILLCIGISVVSIAAWFGMGILFWISAEKNIILTILFGIIASAVYVFIHEFVLNKFKIIPKWALDICVFISPLIYSVFLYIDVSNYSDYSEGYSWAVLGVYITIDGMVKYLISIGILSFIAIMILKFKKKAKEKNSKINKNLC